MTTEIQLSTLVVDEALYPRHQEDDTHISDLVRALASGARLPPIIAEEGTLRVVDGVHRLRAYIKLLGNDSVVPVELRHYDSEQALFLEAVALNSVHGRKLDRHDQTRIVLKLREFGIEDRLISITLHVPEPVVEKLALRVVIDAAGDRQPAKRGLEHLHGQPLSQSQLDAVGSVRSAEVGRLCIELMKLLESRLADLGNPRTVQQLRRLSAVIDAALDSVAA